MAWQLHVAKPVKVLLYFSYYCSLFVYSQTVLQLLIGGLQLFSLEKCNSAEDSGPQQSNQNYMEKNYITTLGEDIITYSDFKVRIYLF